MARQVAKTASYGGMHLVVAITVAYALSGDWRIALGIGIVEPMVQTLAYTLHERLWNRNPVASTPEKTLTGTAVA